MNVNIIMNISIIILFLFIAIIVIMFLYLKSYIKKRTSESGQLSVYRNDINMLIDELDAVTDRNLTLVEDKITKLKEIMEDTDKRISVYVKELERSKTSEALYTSLGRGIRAALNEPASPSLSAVMPELEVKPQPLPPPLPQVQAPPPEPRQPVLFQQEATQVPQSPAQPSKRQIRAQIDNLVNEGLPAEEIASRLEISIAEVELAMNLSKRGKKAAR